MLIATLLVNSNNIKCNVSVSSKKRALEEVSSLLAANINSISVEDIFHALLERERLGSTGLGKGVAVPHARIPGLTHAFAAIMTLEAPIDYDAPDKQGVDIIIALLEPVDEDNHHLEHLSRLATILKDPLICQSIRNTHDPDVMFDLILAIDDD